MQRDLLRAAIWLPCALMNTATDKNSKPGFFARLKQRLNKGKGLGLGSLGWFSGRGLDDELEEETMGGTGTGIGAGAGVGRTG